MAISSVLCHCPVSLWVDVCEWNCVMPKMVNENLVLLVSVISSGAFFKGKLVPKGVEKRNEMQPV